MLRSVNSVVKFVGTIGIMGFSSVACSKSLLPVAVVGNKNVVEETRDVRDFSSVSASGNVEVSVEVGPDYHIKVRAEENLMKHIEVYKQGSKLVLTTQNGLVLNRKPIEITVLTPELHKIEGHGAPKLDVKGISVDSFEALATGAADIKLSGETQKLSLKGDGSGLFQTVGLHSVDVHVRGSGATEFEVLAKESLKVNLSGACSVRYKGDPELQSSLSGVSKVSRF